MELSICYELMQVFTVTGLFAGQHNTKLHGTITGVIYEEVAKKSISTSSGRHTAPKSWSKYATNNNKTLNSVYTFLKIS